MLTNKVTFMDWLTVLVIVGLASGSVYLGIKVIVSLINGFI